MWVSSCTYFWREANHILSCDQQEVRDIVHFSARQSNHILSYYDHQAVCDTTHFSESSSHHILPYDQQEVSDSTHFLKGSLFTCCPITNREWVTHIAHFQHTVSSHLVLLMTIRKWVQLLEQQSYQSWFYGQQRVSVISYFSGRQTHQVLLWPTVCGWHCKMAFWKVVSSDPVLQPLWLGSEEHHTFFWNVASLYLQQNVSVILQLLTWRCLITHAWPTVG